MILEDTDDEVVESKKKEKVAIKKTGLPALDAIMAKVSKDLGQDLSGTDYGDMTFCTSGSVSLDIALARGGLPLGRIIEFIGMNSCGKTSIALSWIATRQQERKAKGITDKRDLIIDVEHSLERGFIEGFTIDMDQVIWIRVDSIEEAFTVLIEYVKSGCIDMVLLDSIDAMENEKMIRRAIGENDVGGMSKEMNKGLRQLAKLAPQTGTTIIFINQIKMNPGKMFGNPETQTGGSAILFYATVIIKMLSKKPGPSDLPNSTTFRLRVEKTKVGPPVDEDIEVVFVFGKGIDKTYDIINMAQELDILKNSAGQSKVRWTYDSDPVPVHPEVGKGKEATAVYLREHPEVLERLYHSCLRAKGIKEARTDDSFKTPDPVIG